MKALTICQPYAELILLGLKRVENRSKPTRHRGPLLIHAGKSRDWLRIVPQPPTYEGCPDMSYDRTSGLYLADMDFGAIRSEEHTSALQSLMRISYAVFCLKKKNKHKQKKHVTRIAHTSNINSSKLQ